MKINYWLLLAIMTLMFGCAQGYSGGPAYHEEETTKLYKNPYQNPETPAEQEQRIWQESLP